MTASPEDELADLSGGNKATSGAGSVAMREGQLMSTVVETDVPLVEGLASDSGAPAVMIGMGSGGEDVVGRLAEAGVEVVGIDRALVGGKCPWGGI